jgi:hypothetical protein
MWGREQAGGRPSKPRKLRNSATNATDGTFSDIYLNYPVGQVLIGGSRKRGTSRLERVKKLIR